MRERVTERIRLQAATVVAALVLAVLLSACFPFKAPPAVTPEAKVAYTANEVLKRVQELQNATIAAEASQGIPTNVAFVVVTFTVEAAKVLRATPAGWGQTVAQLWASAKGRIPIQWLTTPKLQAVILAVDVALAIFVPAVGGAS